MTSERYTPNWTPGVQITSKSSSPWSSATMVGRWQGAASRSLIMHSDPLAAYAYRWLDGVASRERIDRCFGWFWNHLRGLGRMHDMVVCSNSQLAERLRSGGLGNTETLPMGVEPGIFSPKHRSATLREGALERLGLDRDGVLLIGVGRFSAEKRWDMVMRAVAECARTRAVALLLVGDGRKRQALELLADQLPNVAVIPKVTDRHELARLMASADALIHGCEAETFCMVAAEARASGIPLIVPDRGAATDQLVRGAGAIYRSADERSLERAIERFIDRGPELQRAAAARASTSAPWTSISQNCSRATPSSPAHPFIRRRQRSRSTRCRTSPSRAPQCAVPEKTESPADGRVWRLSAWRKVVATGRETMPHLLGRRRRSARIRRRSGKPARTH